MKTARMSKRNGHVMLATFVVLSVIAVLVVYNMWREHVFYVNITQLSSETDRLRIDLTVMKNAQTVFRNLTEDELNSLESTVDRVGAEVNSSSEERENSLATHYNESQQSVAILVSDYNKLIHKDLDSLKSAVSNTQTGLNSLGKEFSSYRQQSHSFDFSSRCYVQQTSCHVPASKQGAYWKSCATERIYIDVPVSYGVQACG